MEQIVLAQKELSKQKLDALLVSSAYNIGYLTDFFGFSKIEREGYVLLTKNHTYFFASGLNSEAVKKHISSNNHPRGGVRRQAHLGGVTPKLVEISPRAPLTKKALAGIIRKEKIKRLGFEKHTIIYSEFEKLEKDLKVTLVPTEYLIENLRMIKAQAEIEAIEKACRLGDVTFEYILSAIKPGITEKELAFEIELFIRRHGGEISFPPIAAFGTNSSIPHHVTNDKGLMINDKFVLLDFGVRIDNYCSDMTRSVFLGKASKEQKKMYQTVLESQQKAIEHLERLTSDGGRLKRSVSHDSSEVDRAARSHITTKGFPTIPHSLGHGIGLEVHEPPRLSPKSKDVLKAGMVFSIEPGIYIPGIGGVRIEDLVVLESSGPRMLTNANRKLIEL